MNRVAKFEKISFGQFKISCPSALEAEYNEILIPKRATKYSAGYDFYLPFDVSLHALEAVVIPTGIRAKINDDYFLAIVPRSGLGFNYGLRLVNTIGIIDSDYYYAKNEGHIMIKVMANQDILLKKGSAFCQGIFLQYGITFDDDANKERNGGFGSTSDR